MFEVDEKDEASVVEELTRISAVNNGDGGLSLQFPVVFVGGKMFGGLEKVMGAHISGDLVPILREAGALWLWWFVDGSPHSMLWSTAGSIQDRHNNLHDDQLS